VVLGCDEEAKIALGSPLRSDATFMVSLGNHFLVLFLKQGLDCVPLLVWTLDEEEEANALAEDEEEMERAAPFSLSLDLVRCISMEAMTFPRRNRG
jgi:hypothetical protein